MKNAMNRESAKDYVSYVVDDAGSGRALGADPHAIIRDGGDNSLPSRERKGFKYPSVLIGWQCGFEPMFLAVHSYLDCELDDDEAIEAAIDYLEEIDWFSGESEQPDFIIR